MCQLQGVAGTQRTGPCYSQLLLSSKNGVQIAFTKFSLTAI
jgi:hypothetical protein